MFNKPYACKNKFNEIVNHKLLQMIYYIGWSKAIDIIYIVRIYFTGMIYN